MIQVIVENYLSLVFNTLFAHKNFSFQYKLAAMKLTTQVNDTTNDAMKMHKLAT